MRNNAFLFLALLQLAINHVATSALASPVTLLFQNSLDYTRNAVSHPGFLLSSTPASFFSAIVICAGLSESLITIPSLNPSTKIDLQHLLNFQIHIGALGVNSTLWISQASHAGALRCQAVKAANLAFVRTPCNTQLPTLCTNSAPYSNSSSRDTSARWRSSVTSRGRTFTGYRDYNSFRFLGIPYANPPARWEYSTLYSGSERGFDATAPGASCIQAGLNAMTTNLSEDCLFLNIFTPYLPGSIVSTTALKPVMFWIHGGAFTAGAGSDLTYDGGAFASRGDVVIVTLNYRLSTIGFLALNDGVTNGNYGLGDQITALHWVVENIAAFGGDPNHIAIFGQSAGAGSVRALLASPKADGLFQGAIAQSNLAGGYYSFSYSDYLSIPDEVTMAADDIISLTNCKNNNAAVVRACLRDVDAMTLVKLSAVARFLVVDGTYITSSRLPLNGTTAGVNKVPTIWGWMADDGAPFLDFPTTDQSLSDFLVSESLVNSSLANAIATNGLFPGPNTANKTLDVYNVTSRVTTDIMFRCLDQATVVASVERDVFPVSYAYEFARSYQLDYWNPNFPVCVPPVSKAYPNGNPASPYFRCHSGDLYYVFGTQGQFDLPYRDAEDLAFSQYALDTWSAFGRTFNPNPDLGWLQARGYTSTVADIMSQGTWEPASQSNDRPLRVFNGRTVTSEPWKDRQQCAFLGYPLDYYL